VSFAVLYLSFPLFSYFEDDDQKSFRTRQGTRSLLRPLFALHQSTVLTMHFCWQVRRQLEYTIAEKKGIKLVKPPSTATAVRDIFRTSGIFGLYTGFYLHFCEL
jgi:hypothetical protein